jgi:hypothetical protein
MAGTNMPPMDMSGVTVWELREMAKDIENQRDGGKRLPIYGPYENAILVEALNCLADRKEAERGR